MPIFAKANAYAKLNLGLKIVGRRPDGYHDLLSVFQTIDLCDTLVFEAAPPGSTEVVCRTPGLPSGPDNLVHRAVEALRERTGASGGVRVLLTKVIPVGAGLGGGSSDAATVLRVLNEAWKPGLSSERLREVASGLGSDVPFFLKHGTALASGRGEVLRYVPWSAEVSYVLVQPPFQVSTAWAYSRISERLNFALTGHSKYINFISSIADRSLCAFDLFGCLENDFEPVVAETWPVLTDVRRALQEAGAEACCMTGSGSVMFGVFRGRDSAVRAAARLQDEGHRVFLCRPLCVASEQG